LTCSRPAGDRRASGQLQQGYHLELARRARQRGERLTLIDLIDHQLHGGVSFYELSIGRRRWPALIRQGYLATRERCARSAPTPEG
jgi:hypothetical protein